MVLGSTRFRHFVNRLLGLSHVPRIEGRLLRGALLWDGFPARLLCIPGIELALLERTRLRHSFCAAVFLHIPGIELCVLGRPGLLDGLNGVPMLLYIPRIKLAFLWHSVLLNSSVPSFLCIPRVSFWLVPRISGLGHLWVLIPPLCPRLLVI